MALKGNWPLGGFDGLVFYELQKNCKICTDDFKSS